MDTIRYKRMKIFLIVLLFLTVVLFALQNFGLPFLTNNAVTQYYMANTDIAPYSELTSDMFTRVEVNADEVPSGFVTNFAEVEGHYANGKIHEGDYLTMNDVLATNDEAGLLYTMEITSDYSGPLQYDTYVDIYTLSSDNVTELLFSNKRLYSAGGQVLAGDGTSTETAVDRKYIKVTKQEMLEYYSKLKSYSIIILPVAEAYVGTQDNATSSSTSSYTPSSSTKDEDEMATFRWTIQEGETWESIAQDWGTDVETLQELNSDIDEVEEGINILIPEQE